MSIDGKGNEHRLALLRTKRARELLVHEVYRSVQGESSYAGLPCVFVRLAVCDSRCTWCFVPDTPILTADWSWKPIGALKPGDSIVGIERPDRKGGHGRITHAHVKHVGHRRADTVLVNGRLRTTIDHPFWLTGKDAARRSAVHNGWREIGRANGLRASFLCDPPKHQHDAVYERGWLAGMADGDGCFWTLNHRRGYRRFRLALNERVLLDRYRLFAERAGFALRPGTHQHTGFRGRATMPCLWLTEDGPARAFEVWLATDVPEESWWAGYVGGIIDAEGSLSGRILRIAQAEHQTRTLTRIASSLRGLGLNHTREAQGFYVHRSQGALWRALTSARPCKPSVLAQAMGHNPHHSETIEAVEETGKREDVVALSTTAGSFIASGYVVKNCDTPQAFNRGLSTNADELLARVLAYDCPLVEITGGEPLLQPEILPFMTHLAENGRKVLLETSGAHDVAAVDRRVHIIMDIKCPDSGESTHNRWGNLDVLKPTDEIKFVIASRNDFDWTVDCVRTHKLDSRFGVLVSCAFGHVDPLELASWLLESNLNVRMQLQMHKYIWDPNTRGV